MASSPRLYLLDYGAGNVQSLANSIAKLGYQFEWISRPEDFAQADKLVFPGVGAFGTAVANLRAKGLFEPLRSYLRSGRPYFGICIGMQILFASSAESPESEGLGVIPAPIERFTRESGKAVPHMGWNHAAFVGESAEVQGESERVGMSEEDSYYFVHSFRAAYDPATTGEWAHTTTQYGQELFVSSVRRENVFATQFHPEKSGEVGLRILEAWLSAPLEAIDAHRVPSTRRTREVIVAPKDGFTKRIIACLDVRANDDGDLVVTKGDQYDVREKVESSAFIITTTSTSESPSATTKASSPTRAVRNLGKPVALANRYYIEGADEICLLNITSFRNSPLRDQPMLAVVREAAAQIFVPLTIGGGIKDTVDPDGTPRTALEVAGAYFRAGADKVSLGSEAVTAVEKLRENGWVGDGTSAIETIAYVYGRQAVVVSADPRRVFVDPETYQGPYADELVRASEATATSLGSEGEAGKAWWYQCTIKGGREPRPLSICELARGIDILGAGEFLLNCIDRDGSGRGYDLDLIRLVRRTVGIPVVASSGAGRTDDFVDVFEKTGVEAALAAGIFHRYEVEIGQVKARCGEAGIRVRRVGSNSNLG
ncbi:hypothetical protein BOTBODRAFT_130014 [Botryobasidium botryosum FD-172 SS1]|uniref:Glutamine amidotransferase domain-containing protein n=1 Tax=Botryobasidium botryosum (strain FD-172 SS1) TaxID=930990 RepID=A0A067ML04_BOTB1|nr:hypothetical protein BOTBODRAFT_130014 [Botryobasidium botryosum FD-172 SS1]